jgi:hypothetical protein
MTYHVKNKVPSLQQDVFFPILLLGRSSCLGFRVTSLVRLFERPPFTTRGQWCTATSGLLKVDLKSTLTLITKARLPYIFTLSCIVCYWGIGEKKNMYEENLKGTVSLQFVTRFFTMDHLPTDNSISFISIYFQKFMKEHHSCQWYQISFPNLHYSQRHQRQTLYQCQWFRQ